MIDPKYIREYSDEEIIALGFDPEIWRKTIKIFVDIYAASIPADETRPWFEPVTDENRADWEAQAEHIRNSGQSQP